MNILCDDIGWIICGVLFMLSIYTLSIVLTIRIQNSEYGLMPGRFKLYFIAAAVGVCCNMIDYLMRYSNITDKVWMAKIVILFVTLYKIYSLNHSGNPLWSTGDEYEELDNPFESAVGMSFCIMVAYTFPMDAAMVMAIFFTFASALTKIDKYRFKRIIPMAIINIIEIVIATILVNFSYQLPILWALLVISLIGAVFNILMSSLNDVIFDRLTGDKFLQDY